MAAGTRPNQTIQDIVYVKPNLQYWHLMQAYSNINIAKENMLHY